MYVYIESEHEVYTVGFYDPAGEFISESDHYDTQKAAERVRYLNGGEMVFQKGQRNLPTEVFSKLELASLMIAQGLMSEEDYNMAEKPKGPAITIQIAKTSLLIANAVLKEANK